MPIPNLDNESPINQYVSSSGQTEFVFSFYIFATSDIKVYVNDVLKTITTDYVVRKNDGGVIGSSDLPMDGGKIIFNVGQVAGAKISINRDIPINRYTQFVTGGDFKADAFNTELTRILAIQQQLNRDISRSFRLAPSDAEGGSLQLPTNRASNILAFDANANLTLIKLADIDKANVSPFIATLLDDVSASVARGTLDAQQLNANLTTLAGLASITNLSALAGLTGASNKLPYFTGAGAMAVRDLLATTTTQGISYLLPNRNILINGAMAIDQRNSGASQTITAGSALAYTVDRWYAYCTGANATGQRVAGTAPNQFNYRFTGASSITKIGFAQRIEASNCQHLAGKTATLSVDLANSLLTTITWTAWYANTTDTFGTLASPTRTQIATGTFTVNSTLTRYATSIAIPAGATTGIEIEFSVGAQTSGTWTIGRVQLEDMPEQTTFEYRPIQQELSLCQRYFEILPSGIIGAFNSNTSYAYWAYKIQKRNIPTFVASASSQFSSIYTNCETHVIVQIANSYTYMNVGSTASAEL